MCPTLPFWTVDRLGLGALCLGGAFCLVACSQDSHAQGTLGSIAVSTSSIQPQSSAIPIAPIASATQSLQAEAPIIQLALSGFGPVSVSVPLGATQARPVVVAVHGHNVRPERTCDNWRKVTGGYPFVLCPHGLPANAPPNGAVTVGNWDYTLREIEAGFAALKGRFGALVSDGPRVYAGFSMGAKVGTEIVSKKPTLYPLVVFGEGGFKELSQPRIDRYATQGIRRVLLVCAMKECEPTFSQIAQRFEKAHIEAQMVSGGGTVHSFAGPAVDAAQRGWSWLVRDDPSYRKSNAL